MFPDSIKIKTQINFQNSILENEIKPGLAWRTWLFTPSFSSSFSSRFNIFSCWKSETDRKTHFLHLYSHFVPEMRAGRVETVHIDAHGRLDRGYGALKGLLGAQLMAHPSLSLDLFHVSVSFWLLVSLYLSISLSSNQYFSRLYRTVSVSPPILLYMYVSRSISLPYVCLYSVLFYKPSLPNSFLWPSLSLSTCLVKT